MSNTEIVDKNPSLPNGRPSATHSESHQDSTTWDASSRKVIERAVAALHNAGRHDVAIELYELIRTGETTEVEQERLFGENIRETLAALRPITKAKAEGKDV